MFFISRRVLRGRSGKSLIITGVVLLVIGLAITVGSFVWSRSHGGGRSYYTLSPIVIGIMAIVRGVSQSRRGGGDYLGGPGQGIPQPGYGSQPPGYQQTGYPASGYGQQEPSAPRAYDQPGYAAPHYGGQPAPNWYPDPRDPSALRWWDGQAWTPDTQPRR